MFIAPSRIASQVRLPLGFSSRTEWAGKLLKEGVWVCVCVCVCEPGILYIMRTKCLHKYTSSLCVLVICYNCVKCQLVHCLILLRFDTLVEVNQY